ncbi:MAG: DegT/DnrJ/EryC1/StrS family aminotransferase, partial [Acidobacteriaceae bacterium]
MSERSRELREQILQLAEKYFEEEFRAQPFFPGQSAVPVAGKVLDAADLRNLIDASLDCWLTTGRFAAQFERQFARYLDVRGATLVNSGSSANLLAFSALTSPKLLDRAIRPGDEVITVAAGFPTTVNPIIQNRCVPVFIDITVPNYQADASQLEAALSDRTRAIMIAHTLGNPYDLDRVSNFAKQHNL